VVEYDPFLFYEDPYPIYRGLRDEAPVYLSPERRLWVLSRFDDVQRAGRDWRTFSSAEGVDIDDSRLGPGASSTPTRPATTSCESCFTPTSRPPPCGGSSR